MKKRDLRIGDMVVTRAGSMGIYIEKDNEGYFVYPESGYDCVNDLYNEDLTDINGESEFDIMQIYREECGALSFNDFEDGEMIFERDITWEWPTANDAAQKEIYFTANNNSEQHERIAVVTQAFYGNRNYVEISEEDIDHFLQGYTDNSFSLSYERDRSIISIPGANCVLVFNKFQETDKLEQVKRWREEDGYIAKPLATIPEIGVEIYSRCFVCRMDSCGSLKSVQNEDSGAIEKYLAP